LGFALIIVSMVYSLRKRRLGIKGGAMSKWLWMHHLVGFVGGLLALAHTLGNLRGLGVLLAALLVVVLASSAPSLLEARATAPLRRASAEVARRRKERDRLDAVYRDMLAKGTAWTYEGHDAYNKLMTEMEAIAAAEKECERLRESTPDWSWWRYVHYPATAMMFGVIIVHIWAKLVLRAGVL